jgi:ribosomal protein S6
LTTAIGESLSASVGCAAEDEMANGDSKKTDYQITVIFDTRGQRESPDEMRDRVGELVKALGGELKLAESLGAKEFARCRRRQFREGFYAKFRVAAGPTFGKGLLSRLGLDRTVNRTFIERL